MCLFYYNYLKLQLVVILSTNSNNNCLTLNFAYILLICDNETFTWVKDLLLETEEVILMSCKTFLPLKRYVQINRINFLEFPYLDH